MKKSKEWMSIILAMFITTSIILLWLYLLWEAVPFSRSIVWIEKSLSAHYKWISWIEEATYKIKETPWTNISNTEFDVVASSGTFPEVWKWDSTYDKNYNSFSKYNSIEFKINNSSLSSSNFDIDFRVTPKIDPNNWNEISQDLMNYPANEKIFSFWVYWYERSTWEPVSMNWYVEYQNLQNSHTQISFNHLSGSYEWTDCSLTDVLNVNCIWTPEIDKTRDITFKILMTREIKTYSWEDINYLEYQINWNSWTNIISKYSTITSNWEFFWYKKEKTIQSAQMPLGSDALDFSILQ